MNYVVLSANNHPDYRFLMPLTAILWTERSPYKPMCIVHGTSDPILDWLHDAGKIDVCYTTMQSDRMYAKLSRWHSHEYMKRGDVALLQDVDIWPIYGWGRECTKDVTCFYGDAFQGTRHCTSGFRASAEALSWIAMGKTSDVIEKLREQWPDGHEFRHSDDAYMSHAVLNWMERHPNDYELIKRGESPPKDRIDRSAWPQTFDIKNNLDAHLPRDASDRRVWNTILPLFDLLAPNWSGWVRAYRDAWERQI